MTAVPPIGKSATLTVNDGVAAADQAFLFPFMINVPSGDVNKIDITNMLTAGRDRVFIPGLVDNGTASFEAMFCKADWIRLVALRGVLKTWKVTFPDDGTGTPQVQSFSGFVTKFPTKFEIEAIPMMSVEIQISGPITYA